MKRERWAEIQQGEFAYHEAKDGTKLRKYKLPYWRELLGLVSPELKLDGESRVLEIGCGSCGLLLAIEQGHLVGIDPLMNRYLKSFPYLAERSDIRWIDGTAEETSFDEPFDAVLAINSFDHVFDPAQVVRRIREILRPGGHCVVTMNTHNTRFFRNYYKLFYRFIDPHHPFQFTTDDVLALFGQFTPVMVREIDDLWFPYSEGYYREVLKRPVESKRVWARAALNPLKWPMGLCKFGLDMPPHKKRAGQRSIYSDYLYVFRLEARG